MARLHARPRAVSSASRRSARRSPPPPHRTRRVVVRRDQAATQAARAPLRARVTQKAAHDRAVNAKADGAITGVNTRMEQLAAAMECGLQAQEAQVMRLSSDLRTERERPICSRRSSADTNAKLAARGGDRSPQGGARGEGSSGRGVKPGVAVGRRDGLEGEARRGGGAGEQRG